MNYYVCRHDYVEVFSFSKVRVMVGVGVFL